MAEREPTVIKRMVTKYINTLNHQREDCRDATLAMLAAVRELVVVAREADTPNGDTVADWIAGWVRECENSQVSNSDERRAGGKGE